MLIQNAAADERCRELPAVGLGMTRYLGVPVFDAEGAALGTLCLLDDRSDLPLGREDIQFLTLLAARVNSELSREWLLEARLADARRHAARLETMNRSLSRAAEDKRRLLTAVVHDLKQPITALSTAAYLLQEDLSHPDGGEGLALIRNRVTTLERMIDELMQYVELDAGDLTWRLEDVELGAVLHQVLDECSVEAAEFQVDLFRELEHGLGRSRSDRRWLTLLVRNLVSNGLRGAACAARPGEKYVTVRARADAGSHWWLEVKDTGDGLSHAQQLRLLRTTDPGGPPEPPEEAPAGRGLGLDIVREVSASLGGSIEVLDHGGYGTTIRVRLPRHLGQSAIEKLEGLGKPDGGRDAPMQRPG